MSLEEALAANTAAANRNSDLLEQVVAGQQAAMEKLAAGGTGTRKPRAAKADPAVGEAGNGESGDSAPTESPEAGATAAPDTSIAAGITTEDQMKEYVSAWTAGTEDAAERAKRVGLLKGVAEKLGVAPKFAELVPHAAKVVFFIERAKATGVDSVDVNAAYDFDGDPAQTIETDSGSDFG